MRMCGQSTDLGPAKGTTNYLVLLSSLVAFLLFVFPCQAAGLPFEYRSTDMTEIEANLGVVRVDDTGKKLLIGHHDPATKDFVESQPTLTIRIPRAYIRLAHPYTRKRKNGHPAAGHKVLPEKIFADWLSLVISFPTGLPYTELDAKDRNRLQQIHAEIRPIPNGLAHKTGFRSGGHYPGSQYDKGKSGNFRRYVSGNREHLYDDQAHDDVFHISCPLIEKSRPLHFCKYKLALNAHVKVILTFVDYRFHGGLPFVRNRIQAFKQSMCPIFGCDEADPALRGAAFIGDKRRVCTQFDATKRPKRNLTFGYSSHVRINDPNVGDNEWRELFEERSSELTSLDIPEDYIYRVDMTRDRPEVAKTARLMLFESDLGPLRPVKQQFRQPGRDIDEIHRTCLRWENISMGQLERTSSWLTLSIRPLKPSKPMPRATTDEDCARPPRRRKVERRHDLDFDGLKACKYSGLNYNHVSYLGDVEGTEIVLTGTSPERPGRLSFNFGNIRVVFGTNSLRDWRDKYRKIVSFLQLATSQKINR